MSSNDYRQDKYYLSVHALDLFTKIFCIKENENDLSFECNDCPFLLENSVCAVKQFAAKYCPTYREFGSMGEL